MYNKSDNIKFTPWVIWFVGALFYFYENLLQVSPGVMTQSLMQYFTINETQLSILAAFYFYAYAFIQIPAGILIDNYNIRKILLCAIFLCVLGCLLFWTASTLIQASCGRFLIGLGSGFAAITSMKLSTSWFAPKKFPFLVGLMVTLGMTGSIVGEGPLALLVDRIGWQHTILFFAVSGIVLFTFVALIVKENPEKNLKINQRSLEKNNIFSGLKEICYCTNSWGLALYAGLMFAPTVIFGGLWGVPFIMEFYTVPKPVAASIVSVLFLGWVIGSPLIGIIASYFNRKIVMFYGTLGTLLTLLLMLYYRFETLNELTVCIFIFGFLSSCFLPAFSLIKDLHKSCFSGVVLGFMNTANTLAGAFGLTFIGFLFKVNWEKILGKSISVLMNYQIILSILPCMILISLLMISIFNLKEDFIIKASDELVPELN